MSAIKDKDKKTNLECGECPVCDSELCCNCGKCCHCGTCNCEVCHAKERDNEPHIKEPINYS